MATGLLNPRGITVAPDGTIFVAEAGTGGTEPDFPSEPAGSPDASASASPSASGSPQPVGMHGDTGQVTMITPDGQQSVFVSGLTSYSFLGETIGPAGVVVADDGTVFISVGGPGPGLAQFVPAGTAGWVVSVDITGTVTPLANIAQYERDNNPDPNQIDSNLGGMAIGTDGLLYVADSGGNTVYTVDPASGEINVAAVIPGIPSPDGAANPERGGAAEIDPVPTSVFADPAGGVWVGLLTGAALWGTPDAAKIIHVGTDGTITDAVAGVNMVTGVAVATDGSVYASELSTSFVTTPPSPGDVVVAQAGGTPEVAFDMLPFPYGLAFAPDGQSIYIVINSTGSTDASPMGEVLNCQIPAGPVGTPAASPAASASPGASASAPASTEPSPIESTEPSSSPSTSP